ncbi:hypothetical protein B9Z55_023754 [Caenorhabditis nigoni]|uniref:Uncharacterized protein n=1 Tax=Caenorhabditis nigoni TaxID=1611254 RepID=A0A2G5SRS3_9PELO|nr:hypothetical protein B9Z55_023754 [Caenorhabditis nigoni]
MYVVNIISKNNEFSGGYKEFLYFFRAETDKKLIKYVFPSSFVYLSTCRPTMHVQFHHKAWNIKDDLKLE